ncbi:hypothetical protein K402DRAFT_322071 [Aulographum hederae CBS 113979]|uniref:TAFII55 protein conserved region domain-containing protein n=1 Tax=Aulographum hederae CBS 113979 TaxID=1176131 RepID=A0A6G1HFG8_9PEZI|nr:hypothetical protein K402DRAFT_322071 [Aulographum hederae CBS 113979]
MTPTPGKTGLKLKLNTKPLAAPDGVPPTPGAATPGGTKLKLNFSASKSAASTPAVEKAAPLDPPAPKPKRKYERKKKPEADAAPNTTPKSASKKRARADNDDQAPPAAKRAATGGGPGRKPSIKLNITAGHAPAISGTQKIKLKNLPKPNSSSGPGPARIIVKHKGEKPKRPPGVGYDSEAEDIEEDPVIHNQFILRMLPGDDCDYLRNAIANRKIGKPLSQGGADVKMMFFDKEGKQSMITIRGNHYAAALVDLPTVIEAQKSWEKRTWYKSGDICQMLLVLGRVQSMEEAKKAQLPPEIREGRDWPSGITPPMYNARARRFRKRVSYRTIEAVEEEFERLVRADEDAEGEPDYQVMDIDEMDGDGTQAGSEVEQDLEDPDADGEAVELNEEDLLAAFEQSYEEELQQREAEADALSDGEEPSLSITQTTENGIDAATLNRHLAAQNLVLEVQPETDTGSAIASPAPEAETPAAAQTSEDEDDDDDDEEEEEQDDEQRARQQEELQIREEIEELRATIKEKEVMRDAQPNIILKKRVQGLVNGLKDDLRVKLRAVGEEMDDD